ncbi:4'-phosphopantetheinyl transferase [Salmonella enterica subsp. enterica serovar Cerro]|nr:4'-phosphopantetheinyl transferase [Salmonella enterica]EDV6528305.1 4'-phosphopantetheinyl transferase [Salmonella enterica subsp. enterica serovar Cerro]EEE0687463.1 4'-phosphopantetheinyl transferase [Salmonella enterica subsp. enterica serovar Cerro]
MSGGKLPEGWVQAVLGDYLYLKNGFAFKSTEYVTPGAHSYPVIRISDLDGTCATDSSAVHVLQGAEGFTVEKGDLLIAMSGATTGKIGIYAGNIPAYQNQRVGNIKLRSSKYGDEKYRNYLITSASKTILDEAYGGAQPNISGKSIEALSFHLAPLAEQKIIAEKLDTLLAQVDSTKARLEQIPQILKRFRQAVLAAAVNGNLNKNAKPNTKVRTLQDVGIIIKTGPFGSALHKSDYISNGIPVINPMHINDGIISPSLSMTISDKKYAELSSWSLQDGDVIVGRRGEMGRAAVVNIGQSKMLCGTGSMILRTNSNINSKYLELILRSPIAISYFNKEAVGSTMVNLNQKVINSLEVYLPNIEEQQGIVRRVEQLFAWADTIEKQVNNALTRVNSLTQSILAKAFRGELTAQWRAENPDLISGENSAAALLEKIKAERAASGGKKTSRKKA